MNWPQEFTTPLNGTLGRWGKCRRESRCGAGAKLRSYGQLGGELGLNFVPTGLPTLLLQPMVGGDGDVTGSCNFPTQTAANWNPGMTVASAQTLYFQLSDKDNGGPCGANYSFSRGVSVVTQ